MNKHGFTLIELIATIVIMSLILILVMPSIVALVNNNEAKQYDYYADSLIEAAKIYVDKEGKDITTVGSNNWKGCVDITYQNLIDADLIKPFSDRNVNCSNAKVRYTKSEKSSNYKYNMKCIKNSKVVYNHNDISNSTCTQTSTS